MLPQVPRQRPVIAAGRDDFDYLRVALRGVPRDRLDGGDEPQQVARGVRVDVRIAPVRRVGKRGPPRLHGKRYRRQTEGAKTTRARRTFPQQRPKIGRAAPASRMKP